MVRCYVYQLQYDKTIDEWIIELLLVNERISHRDLKRRVEFSLSTSDSAPSLKKKRSKKKKPSLTISFETLSLHLERLQSDGVLHCSKEGMYSFYSLTEKYKKERLFDILGVHIDQIIIRAIYTRLFYLEASYARKEWLSEDKPLHENEWLINHLKEKKAKLEDMREIYSNRNSIENKKEYENLTFIEIITDYKLKKTGEIISKIEYLETMKDYRNIYRVLDVFGYPVYYFDFVDKKFNTIFVPGISEDFLMRDKVIREYFLSMDIHKWKAKELLQSLVESHLVQRSSSYGTDYFMIVDDRLRHLIHDFQLLRTLKVELERERPDSPIAWILSRREKTAIFKIETPSGNIKLKEEYKDIFLKERERQFNNIVKNIREKHANNLKQYVFLHDTIRELYSEILK